MEKSVEEEEGKIKKRSTALKSGIKKSLIIPAIIICVLAVALCIAVTEYILPIIIVCILMYITTVQIIWGIEPVADIFIFFLGGPKWAFGLIFELSVDGIIWYFAVKFALWILGIILSVLSFMLGTALSMFIGIFTFPFSLYNAIRHPEKIDYLF